MTVIFNFNYDGKRLYDNKSNFPTQQTKQNHIRPHDWAYPIISKNILVLYDAVFQVAINLSLEVAFCLIAIPLYKGIFVLFCKSITIMR